MTTRAQQIVDCNEARMDQAEAAKCGDQQGADYFQHVVSCFPIVVRTATKLMIADAYCRVDAEEAEADRIAEAYGRHLRAGRYSGGVS